MATPPKLPTPGPRLPRSSLQRLPGRPAPFGRHPYGPSPPLPIPDQSCPAHPRGRLPDRPVPCSRTHGQAGGWLGGEGGGGKEAEVCGGGGGGGGAGEDKDAGAWCGL
eukprot:359210-Chlamydomonas_euryale.AAC.1